MSAKLAVLAAAIAVLAAQVDAVQLRKRDHKQSNKVRAMAKVDYDGVLAETDTEMNAQVSTLEDHGIDYDAILLMTTATAPDGLIGPHIEGNAELTAANALNPEWHLDESEEEKTENGVGVFKNDVEKTLEMHGGTTDPKLEAINMTPYVRATKDEKWEAGVPNFEAPEEGYFIRTFADEAKARAWVLEKSGADMTINYPMAPDVEVEDNPANPLDPNDKNPNTMQDGAVKPPRPLSRKPVIEPAYVGEYDEKKIFGNHIKGDHGGDIATGFLETAAGSGSDAAAAEAAPMGAGATPDAAAAASASGSGAAASVDADAVCAECVQKLDETNAKLDTLATNIAAAKDKLNDQITSITATKGQIVDVAIRRQSDDAAARAAAAAAAAPAAAAASGSGSGAAVGAPEVEMASGSMSMSGSGPSDLELPAAANGDTNASGSGSAAGPAGFELPAARNGNTNGASSSAAAGSGSGARRLLRFF